MMLQLPFEQLPMIAQPADRASSFIRCSSRYTWTAMSSPVTCATCSRSATERRRSASGLTSRVSDMVPLGGFLGSTTSSVYLGRQRSLDEPRHSITEDGTLRPGKGGELREQLLRGVLDDLCVATR